MFKLPNVKVQIDNNGDFHLFCFLEWEKMTKEMTKVLIDWISERQHIEEQKKILKKNYWIVFSKNAGKWGRD